MDMRGYMRLVEGLYDEEQPSFEEESPGSFGWWIYPTGEVEEMSDMGEHGVTAHAWLHSNVAGYHEDAFDASIEHLKELGGIRVATFHGADEMNIDFDPVKATPAARKAALRLMADTRADFTRYWVDGPAGPASCDYRQAAAQLRAAPSRALPG